jgi:hypothetical protein
MRRRLVCKRRGALIDAGKRACGDGNLGGADQMATLQNFWGRFLKEYVKRF